MNKIITALFFLAATIQMYSQARTQIEMTDKAELKLGLGYED